MIPTLCTGFHNVYVLMGCSTSTQMNLRLPERAESTLHEDAVPSVHLAQVEVFGFPVR